MYCDVKCVWGGEKKRRERKRKREKRKEKGGKEEGGVLCSGELIGEDGMYDKCSFLSNIDTQRGD